MNPIGNPPFNPQANQDNNQGNNQPNNQTNNQGSNQPNMSGFNPNFNPQNQQFNPANYDPNIMAQLYQMFQQGKIPANMFQNQAGAQVNNQQTGNFQNMPNMPNMQNTTNMPNMPNMTNMPNMPNNNQQMSPDQTVFLNPGQGINMNNQQGVGTMNIQGNQLNNQQGFGVPMNNQQQIFGQPGQPTGVGMPNPFMPQQQWPPNWQQFYPVPPQPQPNQVPNPAPPAESWTIYFQRKDGQKVMMQFPSDKTIKQACNAYRMKSGEEGGLRFSCKGKPLDESLTLAQANLVDGSIINVEKGTNIPAFKPTEELKLPEPPANFVNIIFEQKTGGQSISIQISLDKKVSDAITAYRNKMPYDGEIKFIFNGINLDPILTLKAAGIKNMSKILVITTKEIEGA